MNLRAHASKRTILIVLAVFGSIFALAVSRIQGLDVWLHLATGEYILNTRTIPDRDPFSYTTGGSLWVAHEWLCGVLYALIQRSCGLSGLVVFNASLLTLFLFVTFLVCNQRGYSEIAAFLTFLAALTIRGEDRFFIRPDVFSLVFVSVDLWLFTVARKKWPNAIYALPLIQVIWCNLHGGGSILGLIMAGAFSMGDFGDRVFRRRDVDARTTLVVFMLTLAACFINPYGWRVPAYFLNSFGVQFGDIVEWRRTRIDDFLGGAGVIASFAAVAVVTGIGALSLGEVLFLGAMAALGAHTARLIPFLLIAALPAATGFLSRLTRWGRRRLPRLDRLPPALPASVLAVAVVAFTAVRMVNESGDLLSTYRPGTSVNEDFFPGHAVDYVEANHLHGPMFNTYGFGAYLIWRLYPHEKVFMDGRADLHGEDFLAYYRHFGLPASWAEMDAKYGFSFAVIDDEPGYVTGGLDENPAWTLVFWNDRCLVYVKNLPEYATLIARDGFHLLTPNNHAQPMRDAAMADPVQRAALLRELDRSCAAPGGTVSAHLMRAHFYEKCGDEASIQKALVDYETVVERLPRMPLAWSHMGIIETALKDYPQACRMLQTAVTLSPNNFEAHHRLSVAYYLSGDTDDAVRECRKALEIEPQNEAARRNLATFLNPR